MIASVKLKECIPAEIKTLEQLSETDLAFIREGCRTSVVLDSSVDPRLAEVISYVLAVEGSLVRAQLGYMVMHAAGAGREDARRFGVAVEYFHTASLLFDDMPAMDGASYRRGKLCPHLKYSEADTTLAALALITQAYDLLFTVLLNRPPEHAEAARKVMTKCLGAKGILSGQSADVHYDSKTADGDAVLAIAGGKTGTLLSLLLGFPARLFGLPDSVSNRLGKLAVQWGCAYQVLDDFKDCLDSESETGKSVRRDITLDRPNFLIKVGRDEAWHYLHMTLNSTGNMVRTLSSVDSRWDGLHGLQVDLEKRAQKFGQALKSEHSNC